MPERIQLSRRKGWRMPPNTVSVARPGPFGNPWTIQGAIDAGYSTDKQVTARWCVDLYRGWLAGMEALCDAEARRDRLLGKLPQLRGKNLACWCPLDAPCHADVLLELANPPRRFT